MDSISYIYDIVHFFLGNEYINVFEENMREDHKYDVGIYQYESADDGQSYDGYIYRSTKVSVIVNSGDTIEERNRAIEYLESFVDSIENNGCPLSNIDFIEVNHNGQRAYPIGYNAYNILKIACSVNIKYKQVIY